jgi:hypothetical protein
MMESDLKWERGGQGKCVINTWEQSVVLTDGQKLWVATRRAPEDPCGRYIIREPRDVAQSPEPKWLWESGEGGTILDLMCAIEHFGLRRAE